MAAPTFNFKITTPFAKNGIKQTIPETSSTTEISYDQGYTTAYQQPPADGGRFIEMPKFNEALYRAYAAIQELQNILEAGNFTVSEAVTAQTLSGVLGVNKGGTGAATPAAALANLRGMPQIFGEGSVGSPGRIPPMSLGGMKRVRVMDYKGANPIILPVVGNFWTMIFAFDGSSICRGAYSDLVAGNSVFYGQDAVILEGSILRVS